MNRFLIKTVINGLVVVPLLLWFTEATLIGSILASVALSTIAYVLGDQMVLHATNNIIATLADVALAFAFLWMVSYFADWALNFTELLVIVLVLGIVEYVFHRNLRRMDNTTC